MDDDTKTALIILAIIIMALVGGYLAVRFIQTETGGPVTMPFKGTTKTTGFSAPRYHARDNPLKL